MTITGKTRIAGIMGWPVAHSRSPQLHGYWLEKYGVDGAVVPLAVRPDKLDQAIKGLPALGFCGCNVTIPHKEAVLSLMHEVSDIARRIGAVNTVIVGPDGHLTGTNTDAFGFISHLKRAAPNWRADRPATVLGAGGAARAVIAALIDAGVPEIRLLNRTRSRAEEVARHLGDTRITLGDWDAREEAVAGVGLVVNATSLGMAGKPALEIEFSRLERGAVAYDLIYTPLETPFLKTAAARGARTVDGLGMLLHQARPGFQAWFGIEPEVDDALRDLLIKDLGLHQ